MGGEKDGSALDQLLDIILQTIVTVEVVQNYNDSYYQTQIHAIVSRKVNIHKTHPIMVS